ncbi:hypothetical protein Q7C36_011865 [Tachysurus vachellii]|uniref:Ig-like domain-containing protein n=1 Tax=Tachysurus vachellii TaxID=175792 RepID=A0AA88MRJ5_TACVA|nr:hypothetical protein Q7C36_011865 [Tachysurus vachellii]
MLWYQQKSDSTDFSLITYAYGTSQPSNEEGFKDRFSLSKESAQKGTLTISKLLLSDSAVYYCAASKHNVIVCSFYSFDNYICFSTGKANCVTFQQTPSVIAKEMINVTIQCSHDDNNLPRMFWYQQNNRGVMELIGYTISEISDPNYEDGFKDRFTLSRQSTLAGSLTISNLQQSDSAVYYCAASQHSASKIIENKMQMIFWISN